MADYINAQVIQKNTTVFLLNPAVQRVSGSDVQVGVGVTDTVKCPAQGAIIDGDYWAEPVNDTIITGFKYHPYNLASETADPKKPNAQSFAVVRIINKYNTDVWWVLGKSSEYLASCAPCCGDAPVAMPTTLPTIEPCQNMCKWDANKKYFGMTALPVLTGNKRYYAYGHFNGSLLPVLTATGYTSIASLLAALNTATTGAGTAASPYAGGWAVVGTWSNPAGNALKVTQTSGPGTDALCVQVIAVDPSA